ncbi:MAG TPA: phytanoyl-CoA dioxygenase family protein [Planctomycetaceae bacterium]|nr:phytanoyl-CoA dioxygenase family protein [Planctomycetaceae bacterium]
MGSGGFWATRKERRARIRQSIKGKIGAFVAFLMMLVKPFPFLWKLLPVGRTRNMIQYWTYSMLWTFVSSGGTKVMSDQPSSPRVPPTFKPRVEVEPQYRLTEEQIKFFYDNGYLAPLKLFSPEEMAEVLEEVENEVFEPGDVGRTYGRLATYRKSKVYQGVRNSRDRHLDCPAILKLALQKGIFEQVAQLLGPDLLLWRTQLLPKYPGAPETEWHQVSTFTMSGKGLRPVLEPPDRDDLFNVTCWLALEDVDLDNGCMQFWRGSHKKPLHNIIINGSKSFARTSFELECKIPKEELGDCVLKAGEFVIFHERTVHGAPPNSSKTRRRFGMNYRICRPDVYIYRGMKTQESNTFGEKFDLDNWTAILARGEDKFHRNKVKLPSEVQLDAPPEPCPLTEKEDAGQLVTVM